MIALSQASEEGEIEAAEVQLSKQALSLTRLIGDRFHWLPPNHSVYLRSGFRLSVQTVLITFFIWEGTLGLESLPAAAELSFCLSLGPALSSQQLHNISLCSLPSAMEIKDFLQMICLGKAAKAGCNFHQGTPWDPLLLDEKYPKALALWLPAGQAGEQQGLEKVQETELPERKSA